jgi:hypothetical protein
MWCHQRSRMIGNDMQEYLKLQQCRLGRYTKLIASPFQRRPLLQTGSANGKRLRLLSSTYMPRLLVNLAPGHLMRAIEGDSSPSLCSVRRHMPYFNISFWRGRHRRGDCSGSDTSLLSGGGEAKLDWIVSHFRLRREWWQFTVLWCCSCDHFPAKLL